MVARLDAAEQQSQRIHSADPVRQKRADLYSLGHKASTVLPNHLATAWDVALLLVLGVCNVHFMLPDLLALETRIPKNALIGRVWCNAWMMESQSQIHCAIKQCYVGCRIH